MNQERFYDDAEVQEILTLAGAKWSTTDSYDTNDLVKAAAEIGISGDVVEQAAQQVYVLREEKADRREFNRIQLLKYIPLVTVVVILGFALGRDREFQLFMYSAILGAGVVLAVVQRAQSKSSSAYELLFQKWRLKRLNRLSPDLVNQLTDQRIDAYIRSQPDGRAVDIMALANFVSTNFGLSRVAATEMIDVYFKRRPEMMARIAGFVPGPPPVGS